MTLHVWRKMVSYNAEWGSAETRKPIICWSYLLLCNVHVPQSHRSLHVSSDKNIQEEKKNNILTLLHPSSIKYEDIYIHKILTIQFKGAFLSPPVRSRILFSSTSKNMHTVILLNILVQVSAGERLLFVFHLKQLNRIIEFLRKKKCTRIYVLQ